MRYAFILAFVAAAAVSGCYLGAVAGKPGQSSWRPAPKPVDPTNMIAQAEPDAYIYIMLGG